MTIKRIPLLDKQRSKVRDSVIAGEPVMIRAPKYFYKRTYVIELAEEMCSNDDFVFINIDINNVFDRSEIDYLNLFETMKQNLKSKIALLENSEHFFIEAFKKLYPLFKKRTVYVIPTVKKGFEEYQYRIMLLFNRLLERYAAKSNIWFSVIVLDDYKLQYYEDKATHGVSPIDYYTVFEFRGLGIESIEELLQASLSKHFKKKVSDINEIAQRISDISGGHCGIVYEIVDDIITNKWNIDDKYWNKVAQKITDQSQIVEYIRTKFLEDIKGITAKALEFSSPKIVKDLTSPTTQTLRRIGVLKWVSASSAVLCPGIITELVVEYSVSISDNEPLGSLLNDNEVRNYETTMEDYLKEAEDFVVVHISDIHLGPDYNFKPFNKDVEVEDKADLIDILHDDLNSLGLLTKIDLFVISGDLTCKAENTEFYMVKSFIEAIEKRLSIPRERIAIIAGNHDFEWKSPGVKTSGFSSNKDLTNLHFFTQWHSNSEYESCKTIKVSNDAGTKELLVICIDTNAVESEENAGIGRIDMKALSEANNQASHGRDSLDGNNELITWMVFHHHLFPCTTPSIDDVERMKISVMSNASELNHFTDKMNVEIVLHGHEHQPSVTIAHKWPSIKNSSFNKIISIGAGSIGAKKERLGPFSRNQYYIIYRKPEELIVRSRQLGPEGLSFIEHEDLSIKI